MKAADKASERRILIEFVWFNGIKTVVLSDLQYNFVSP